MFTYYLSSFCFGYYDSCYLAQLLSANHSSHWAFIHGLVPPARYNPLPLLMRAVNALRLRWQSRSAPRWRRGRWKSLA